MTGDIKETLIGLLVVLTLAIFIASRYAAGPPEPTGGIRLTATFGDVGSLAIADEVRMGGIVIGRVTDVGLDPESYQARVAMVVDGSVLVPTDSAAKVVSDGLIGGAHIDIDIGGAEDGLAAGMAFEITQDAVNLIELVGRLLFADDGPADGASPAPAGAGAGEGNAPGSPGRPRLDGN